MLDSSGRIALEIIKMVKSGCKRNVRVKDIDDIAAVCVYDSEYDEYTDIETGIIFSQCMIDMCGKVFDIAYVAFDRIYIEYNDEIWAFLPQWIDEVNQFDDDVIETCDEVLI